MAGHMATAKRKLQKSPCKKSATGSHEPEAKKLRQIENNDSPLSSPIKAPLKECADQSSPSFVAKCFYGLKKSELSKENKHSISDRRTSSSDEALHNSNAMEKFDLGNGKTVCPKSPLDKLMLKRVALSPVKQAVLQTCSMSEFRKIFRDEYKELECEVKKQNCRTRTASRIVTKIEDEDEEDNMLDLDDSDIPDSSSDDEVTFKVHNHGLDKERDGKTINGPHVRNSITRRAVLRRGNSDQEISSSSDEESDESDSETEPTSKDNCENGSRVVDGSKSMSPRKTTGQSTPSSCGRKFFKTRSPLDSAKASSVMSRKGFTLKFHAKSPKTGDRKRPKTHSEKRFGPASSKQNGPLTKDARGGSPVTNGSTETVVQPSGFTFAPGVMSHLKEDSADTSNISTTEKDTSLAFEDEHLEVNKSSSQTYEYSPPRNKKAVSENTADSLTYSEGTGLLLDVASTKGQAGSEHLVSSNDLKSKNQESREENHVALEDQQGTPSHRLFPIFSRKSTPRQSQDLTYSSTPKSGKGSPPQSSRMIRAAAKDGQSQMILDAGQKKFGATQCPTCSMVYCHADPLDEAAHAKFHKRLIEVLKFPGWKKERVLQEYAMDLGRVILVLSDDPKYARKKIEEVNQVMGRELGFPDVNPTLNNPFLKVFLYVQDKEIAGCCVAEPINEGYRIIPGDLDTTNASGKRPWCCSKVPESACIGISRLWVAGEKRKSGIATKLVDCVRQWFDYGTLTPKHKIAFSDPTPDGRKFAQTYMGTPTFLVYKYNHQ